MKDVKKNIRIRKSMSNGKKYVIENEGSTSKILDYNWSPVKYKPTGNIKNEDSLED